MARQSLVLIAALAAMAACKSKSKPLELRERGVDVTPGEVVYVIASPRVETGPLPARFAGPLPSTEATIAAAPPGPYVDRALALDRDGMRGRLVDAMARATPPFSLELNSYFHERLRWSKPQTCDWIAQVATGDAAPAVRDVFGIALGACDGPTARAAIESGRATDTAMIYWWFERVTQALTGEPPTRTPFQPRVASAAAALVQRPDYEPRMIGFAFAAMDGPEVVPAMQALQRAIPDPRRRALVALGLVLHPDPAAQQLGRAACAHPAVAKDPMCGRDEPPDWANGPPEAADLGARDAGLPEGLERDLRALGFTPLAGKDAPAPDAVDAADVLEAWGRVEGFDSETDTWPNEHDRLLAALAAAAAPALDGVVFEERAPDLDSEAPYELIAYADGRIYRLAAKNLGDWYDLDAVLGLLNAILVARGSETRVVSLATGDQWSRVLAGSRAAISALVRRQLIEVGPAGAGEAAGKKFEDRVRQAIERGELK